MLKKSLEKSLILHYLFKLVILTQYYYPEIGAPQNRLYELAAGLKDKGWEIAVITGMPNYPSGKIFEDYKGRFVYQEDISGIRIRRYWLYASNSKRAFPRILSMISFSVFSMLAWRFIRREKYDFIFVESPPLTLGITGILLSRLTKAKLIFNASDLWPLSAMELGYLSPGRVYKLLERAERFIYRKAFICTGQSDETVRHLTEKGAKRTFLFRNGVDPDRFKINQRSVNSGNVKLVYAGLLGVAQGVLEICKSTNFAALDAEFHIYGDGPEKDSIISFLKLNDGNGVHFHGSVTRDEIPQILAAYDASLIVLVKNIYGAVPSKVYESMAAGLPIMFLGYGEGRKIVEQYDLGWTSDPGDYAALSEIILRLHNKTEELEVKRKNCLKASRAVFNRKVQIDALHKYLLSFLIKE